MAGLRAILLLALPCVRSLSCPKAAVGSPCAELTFHDSVPRLYINRTCASCAAHTCLFRILNRWRTPPAAVPSGYFFEKVYVIHYTPRTWRTPRMMARVAAIGVPTAPSKGVLNFVDDFDADNFTAEETRCLREGRGRRLATTRSHVPRHVPRRKKAKPPLLTPAQLSVNSKHYAAMLDMLRHGVRYAMIVEDDAAFETGSKIVASAKNKTFDVLKTYSGSTSFNETLLKYIEPHLPTLARKPAGFGGVFGEKLAGNDPRAPYIFDHLSFGACDMHWDKVYAYGTASGAGRPQTTLRKQVTSLESSHVSRSDWSCTRCLISYVSSLSGATRFLEARALPWVASIDIHLTWASGTKVSEGRPADCLWVEPPIVWEDPGAEGDGLVDAARLHRPPAAPAARTAGIGVYPVAPAAGAPPPPLAGGNAPELCWTTPADYVAEDYDKVTDMNTQCVNPEANKLPRAVACPRFMWVESGVYKLLGVEHSAVYKQCPKRIYFDLGVNAFQSSIEWAITKYPVIFDEVHGWEMSQRLFPRIPPADVFRRAHPGRQLPSLVMIYNAAADAVSEGCARAKCPNKAHAARSYCATPATCQRKRELLSKYGCCSRCHIAKYLLDGFAREDFILFKIDIEGVEYKVFDDMVRMGAQYLVNEVMAELHFKTDTPGLVGWSTPGGPAWRSYPGHAVTYEEAHRYVESWRTHTSAFHVWA